MFQKTPFLLFSLLFKLLDTFFLEFVALFLDLFFSEVIKLAWIHSDFTYLTPIVVWSLLDSLFLFSKAFG